MLDKPLPIVARHPVTQVNDGLIPLLPNLCQLLLNYGRWSLLSILVDCKEAGEVQQFELIEIVILPKKLRQHCSVLPWFRPRSDAEDFQAVPLEVHQIRIHLTLTIT
jgi:hypothetical protein